MTQNCLLVCARVVTGIRNRVLQWRPACRYDMSNPQNLQSAQILVQMMAELATLQQQQTVVYRRHLEDLQAQTEQQTRVLQNFLAQFGAAANPSHLDRLKLSSEDQRCRFCGCRMGARSPAGEVSVRQRLFFNGGFFLFVLFFTSSIFT